MRFFLYFGYILLVFSNVIGIGYFLYNWGALDITIGLAAWETFKVWSAMIIVGLVSLFVGIYGEM